MSSQCSTESILEYLENTKIHNTKYTKYFDTKYEGILILSIKYKLQNSILHLKYVF